MEIDGNNNRSAQRDFYEINLSLVLPSDASANKLLESLLESVTAQAVESEQRPPPNDIPGMLAYYGQFTLGGRVCRARERRRRQYWAEKRNKEGDRE